MERLLYLAEKCFYIELVLSVPPDLSAEAVFLRKKTGTGEVRRWRKSRENKLNPPPRDREEAKRNSVLVLVAAAAEEEPVHGAEEGVLRKLVVVVVADDRDLKRLLVREKAFRVFLEEDVRGLLAVVLRDELFAGGLAERARGGIRARNRRGSKPP